MDGNRLRTIWNVNGLLETDDWHPLDLNLRRVASDRSMQLSISCRLAVTGGTQPVFLYTAQVGLPRAELEPGHDFSMIAVDRILPFGFQILHCSLCRICAGNTMLHLLFFLMKFSHCTVKRGLFFGRAGNGVPVSLPVSSLHSVTCPILLFLALIRSLDLVADRVVIS